MTAPDADDHAFEGEGLYCLSCKQHRERQVHQLGLARSRVLLVIDHPVSSSAHEVLAEFVLNGTLPDVVYLRDHVVLP